MEEILAHETRCVNNETTKKRTGKTRGRPAEVNTIINAIRLYNYLPHRINAKWCEVELARMIGLIELEDLNDRKKRNRAHDQIRQAKNWLLKSGYIRIHKSKKHEQSGPHGFIQHKIEKLRGGDHQITEWEHNQDKLERFEAEQLRKRKIKYHIDNIDITYGGDAALAVEAFRSVGVQWLEFFWLDRSRSRSRDLAKLIARNRKEQIDLSGRPYEAHLIQIDDVTPELLPRLKPLSFLTIQTSPQSYHVWIALPAATSEAKLTEVKDRLFAALKMEKANRGPSGCSRWPDSINWKPEHNAFRVRVNSVTFGGHVTQRDLDRYGLQADIPEAPVAAPSNVKAFRVVNSKFPRYEWCLKKKNGIDHRADAEFIWICFDRGFTIEEIKSEIKKVSPKVRKEQALRRGDYYLDRTINYILKRRQRTQAAAA